MTEEEMKFVVIVNENHAFLVYTTKQNEAINKVVDEYTKHGLSVREISSHMISQEIK